MQDNGYDGKLVEMIESVIVDRSPSVNWEDIGQKLQHFNKITFIYCVLNIHFYISWHLLFTAGLEKAKQTLLEMVILPTKRKDLFTGLRRPSRGIIWANLQFYIFT